MSKIIEGRIQAVSRRKNFGTYGVKIDDEWYNTKKKPGGDVSKGNTVKVKYVVKNNRKLVQGTKLVSKGKAGGYGGGSGGRGMDPEREKKIVWQHSQQMAISTASAAVSLGAVPGVTDKSTGKTKLAKLQELIEDLTIKYFKEVFEQGPLKEDEEVDEDLDDDDEDEEDEDFEGDDDEDDDEGVDWDDD